MTPTCPSIEYFTWAKPGSTAKTTFLLLELIHNPFH
jgi:hypothetical protein